MSTFKDLLALHLFDAIKTGPHSSNLELACEIVSKCIEDRIEQGKVGQCERCGQVERDLACVAEQRQIAEAQFLRVMSERDEIKTAHDAMVRKLREWGRDIILPEEANALNAILDGAKAGGA